MPFYHLLRTKVNEFVQETQMSKFRAIQAQMCYACACNSCNAQTYFLPQQKIFSSSRSVARFFYQIIHMSDTSQVLECTCKFVLKWPRMRSRCASHQVYRYAESSRKIKATVTPTIRTDDGRDTFLPSLALVMETCFKL